MVADRDNFWPGVSLFNIKKTTVHKDMKIGNVFDKYADAGSFQIQKVILSDI